MATITTTKAATITTITTINKQSLNNIQTEKSNERIEKTITIMMTIITI